MAGNVWEWAELGILVVETLAHQIEAAEGFAQLDDLWIRAEELGITHRVEFIWKGRKAKLQRAQERLLEGGASRRAKGQS